MKYRIAVTAPTREVVENYTRNRSDAAELLLETVVYRLIRNCAKLDTKAGQAAWARAQLVMSRGGGFVDVGGLYGVMYTVSKK